MFARSAHHYSVDCTHANTGLFTGILVMVLTIISLIVFFVLINNNDEGIHDAAITVASLTELALYSITTIAVIVGMLQVRIVFQSRDFPFPISRDPHDCFIPAFPGN
jgi:cytochrome b561